MTTPPPSPKHRGPITSMAAAQQDMRWAYYDGATGLLCSGSAWLIASLVGFLGTPINAIVTLLVGGTMIFPASMLLSKIIGRSGSHTKGNPLGPLAIEGTIMMMLGIVLAVAIATLHLGWFFPAMLIIIGARYLTFSTLYGDRIYWLCGGVLAAAGLALGVLDAPVALGALAGGAIEVAFAAVVFLRAERQPPKNEA